MRFENVAAFYWLWLLPAFWFLNWILRRRANQKMKQALGDKTYPFLSSSVSIAKRRWKGAFLALSFLFFVLALARPQMGQSKMEVKSEGVELMLMVDVSDSMMAEDLRPNRLEQAKSDMSKLIDLMPGSRVGIVAFAGSANLLSPLTSDPSSLKMFIESLSPTSVSSQGTVFKDGIDSAVVGFERGGVEQDEVTKVTRVILIASDGEDHEPEALAEAEKIVKDKGIRVFTLAYGTEKGAPIPERDAMGFLRGYKKDNAGQTVLTTVKGEALRTLAQVGEGSFNFATVGGSHLQRIVSDIDQLEKAQFDTEIATQYDEKYQIFLAIGLLFLLLELWLGERRSAFKLWKGRFEVPVAGLILSLLGLAASPRAQALERPDVIFENNRAIKKLEKGQIPQSQSELLGALAKSPDNVALHLNLGQSFEKQEQFEKALTSYQTAAKLGKDPVTLFAAWYNIGALHQKAQKKDEALLAYQNALTLDPTSIHAKTNIELLMNDQQQQGGGEGESKDNKEKNEENKDGKGDQQKDQKDQDKDGDGKDKDKDQPKTMSKGKAPPPKFKSEELTQGDVNKILGELKQQESKIRAEFNRKESKDQPRDKDW